LGLAITKHVMQRHGGELRIESVLGQGATFKLCLPLSRVSIDLG
jgi:two-component system phosphate regulon sensor histidine kinase PhoR